MPRISQGNVSPSSWLPKDKVKNNPTNCLIKILTECHASMVLFFSMLAGVQGTCKYGTRVDYILASPNSPYKFVPGSYSVLSSKGTSDHHIVKVDVVKTDENVKENGSRKRRQQPKQRVVKITADSSPSKSIWKTHTWREIYNLL